MFARISIMTALNRGHVREFDSSRKDHHWGRRKLGAGSMTGTARQNFLRPEIGIHQYALTRIPHYPR
jgi:hypothetical protein